jgi:uncharacterized protein
MTAIRVQLSDDPKRALVALRSFLGREPVTNNVLLTLLHECAKQDEPGHYWVATLDGAVVGAALQHRSALPLMLPPMELEVIAALAAAVVADGASLPGVMSDAATAARFAGCWAELSGRPAVPARGHRIYELLDFEPCAGVSGVLRIAHPSERETLIDFLRAFQRELDDFATDPSPIVDQAMASGGLVVWDAAGKLAAMAATSEPLDAVVRVRYVYTPPPLRKHGYASACVSALSGLLLDRGQRVMLHTDLANPVSNSIYRRLGYRAVIEGLFYKFG